jgi:hypothetical protein
LTQEATDERIATMNADATKTKLELARKGAELSMLQVGSATPVAARCSQRTSTP